MFTCFIKNEINHLAIDHTNDRYQPISTTNHWYQPLLTDFKRALWKCDDSQWKPSRGLRIKPRFYAFYSCGPAVRGERWRQQGVNLKSVPCITSYRCLIYRYHWLKQESKVLNINLQIFLRYMLVLDVLLKIIKLFSLRYFL